MEESVLKLLETGSDQDFIRLLKEFASKVSFGCFYVFIATFFLFLLYWYLLLRAMDPPEMKT